MQSARPFLPLRRPLIGLALAFGAGIWGAVRVGGLSPGGAGALAAGLLGLALAGQAGTLWLRRRRFAPSIRKSLFPADSRLPAALATLALYLSVAAAGWCLAALRLDDPSPQALSALMDKPREGVELEGIVAAEPVIRADPARGNEQCTFPLRLEALRRLVPWQAARGQVWVILPAPAGSDPPRYGERWRLAGVLTDNARFPDRDSDANPEFQSKIDNRKSTIAYPLGGVRRPVLQWLKRRYTFRADPAAAARLVAGQGSSWRAACIRARRACADQLALGIGHRPEIVGLLQALLLGYRQELPEKLRNDFIATGTYHVFAISGQHVAILAMFMIVVLQARRVPRVRWFLYVAPLLAAFTVATGMSASAVRGCLMALLCFLGPLAGRKPDVPSAMALAALIILAADPFQLFDYGFLLSFTAVTGLIVLCPPLLQRTDPVVEPDAFRLQPESRWVRWGRSLLRWFLFLLIASWAAWLATAPLAARWFNLVSPVALLANLAVIPAATLALLAGCLAIVSGMLAPVLAEIFNFANVALVSCLLGAIDLMARIPGGHAYVASPPAWSVAAWYGVLAGWIAWRDRRWGWLAGPVLLALAAIAGLGGGWKAAAVDVLYHGDYPVCFINLPGGGDRLVDAGSRYHARKVIRHLRRQGVNRLSVLALTGVDAARAGAVPEILQAIPVRELWLPPGAENAWRLRPALDLARARGVILRPWPAESAQPPADRLDLLDPGGAAGVPPAWRFCRGTHCVLCFAGDSLAGREAQSGPMREQTQVVWIECRPGSARQPDAPAPPDSDCRPDWRIVCGASAFADGHAAGPPGANLLRLAPGQGIRIRLDGDPIRLAPLGEGNGG